MGIAQLMDAETKASQVVSQARKERTEMLKAAKKEGLREIEQYIKEKEFELDQQRKRGMQEHKSEDQNNEIDAALRKNEAGFKATRKQAVDALVKAVYNCSIMM